MSKNYEIQQIIKQCSCKIKVSAYLVLTEPNCKFEQAGAKLGQDQPQLGLRLNWAVIGPNEYFWD